ncbi:hypothetical protein Bca52824_005186 [Brassica carinata]|uniref:sucrose synthase n=1 Tax=Brassica carinata TaxID=52824 RepID=A0A8X7WPM6_BRACI|nr:hypothetical protein Bca52824_005186 [Brassica carinata]
MTWQRRKQQAEIEVFSPAIQAPLLIRCRPRRLPAPETVRSATVRLPPLSSWSPLLCTILHMLWKTKYPDSDIYWEDFDNKYHFSC